MVESASQWKGVAPIRNRRYLAAYLTVLMVGLGGVYWTTSTLSDFRETPVNFYEMADDEVLTITGLTRQQRLGIKIAFLRTQPAPALALFGNHMSMYFGRDAFPTTDRRYFFNYWMANLSLPELRDSVQHAVEIGKLPDKTLLVQVTTPNNDNGLNILGYRGELPFDMIQFSRVLVEEGLERARNIFDAWFSQYYYRLSYSSFFASLAKTEDQRLQERVLKRRQSSTEDKRPGWPPARIMNLMPGFIRGIVLDQRPQGFSERQRSFGLLNDGSMPPEYQDRPLVLNENPLDDSEKDIHERALQFGDEPLIADYMREIARLGSVGGRTVVFIIPPVYETRRSSAADRIFSAALEEVRHLNLIDHRHRSGEADMFTTYDHPSRKYYREVLVPELRENGWLPSQAP